MIAVKYSRKVFFYFLPVLIVFFLFPGCKKENNDLDPDNGPSSAKYQFYELMKEWYLWYKEMPQIKISDYDTPNEILEALRYSTLDKWSYISSLKSYVQYYEEGKYVGHGFGYKWDDNGNFRISFVFENSPSNNAGIKRGWKIIEINGSTVNEQTDISSLTGESTAGISNNFKFKNNSDSIVHISMIKDTVVMNTVLHCDTIKTSEGVTGHLVFKSFIQTSEEELEEAFSFFQDAGINDLVLDLRYNGGGRMNITLYLANLLSGNKLVDQDFTQYIHNDKQSNYNFSYSFEEEVYSLDLERLIVITSKNSASASEALINGLKPYIEVVQIGDDTYGKPVGMYAWEYQDFAFVPISFYVANSNGESNYFDGLPADAYVDDDLTREFKNQEEDCLKEALYYINYGTFSDPSKRLKRLQTKLPEVQKYNLKTEIGAI